MMMPTEEPQETSTPHDPYSVLNKSIENLQKPVTDLLRNHNELVVQNLSILSNLNTVPKLNQDIKTMFYKS